VRVERKAIGLGGTITLALPFPPSSKTLWEIAPDGGRVATKRYREWRRAAHAEILRQRPRLAIGPVEVTISLQERPGRRDADTLIKPVLDCLIASGVIASDQSPILRRVTAEWSNVEGARVEIKRLS